MRQLDVITLRLKQSKDTTKVRLSGSMQMQSASSDAARLLQLLSRLHEPLSIALPADAPWSWLELWAEHIDAAEGRLEIQFLLPRRAGGGAEE